MDYKILWERLVIEGIATTPRLFIQLQVDYADIKFETTFLFDDNVKRITRRKHQRGLWGPVDSYPASLKDKEVQCI